MRFLPYRAYEPSGVDWLGNIPQDWATKRLKYIVSVNDDVLNEETDPDWVILYVDIGNVDAALGITRKEEIRFEDAPSRARRRVADGDTIVSTVRTYLKAIAPIDRPEPNLVVSTGFAVIRPRDIDSRFMAYCLRSSYFVETVVSHSVGVSYPATNPSEIMTILIPLPMLAEQQSIAAFLDRETRHIDLLVKTKRKLIERLKEKRSALISRTVTRGLPQEAARATGMPENPPLKPTNNDWIREIPAHWDIVPYKRMCTRVDVGIAEAATHAYCDDGVPIIRSKNVKPNRLDASELLRIEPWFAEKNRSKTLHSGDLVTVRTGYPGTTAIVPPELDGSQCFTLVLSTPKKATHGPFYSWFLNSQPGATYFEAEGWGTAQTNISVPIVQFMPVPRPPHAEQVAISNYLKKETAKFDRLIIATETAIERLQEYRAALINAAVTGKIDVGRSIA